MSAAALKAVSAAEPQPETAPAVPALELRGVGKRYGDSEVLKDINLSIADGEFVAIVGFSGSGKTTLVSLLAGLVEADAGEVLKAGQPVRGPGPDCGVVFQSYSLMPWLSVRENVALAVDCAFAGRPKTERRARTAHYVEMVGLSAAAYKRPAELSGGMRQRVAVARALAANPDVLLLDEPLSALDAKVRTRLRGEVKDLQRRLGVTTIMVTHDQEEALTMADRIVVMNQGVIEQVGSPEAIYGEPATAFVADFVGTMNFLPARAGAAGVMLGGVALRCAHDAHDGEAVTVAVRPEDLILDAAPGSHANLWQVRVVSLEFLGSFVRATLAFGEGDGAIELLADVSINLVRRTALAAGQAHQVALPDERIRVYRQSGRDG